MSKDNVGKIGDSLQDAKTRMPGNVIYNFAGYLINIVVTFLIMPLVVHRLGNTVYGIWSLIGQILGYSFVLDFGIRIAVTRYVGRYLALNEPRQINTVLTTGLAFSTFSAALALLSGGVVAIFLPQLFAIPPSLVHDARLAVIFTSIAFATSFPGSLFSGCVAALSRYDLLNIRNVIPNVLRGLLLWYFLRQGYGLAAVAAISGLSFVLTYILDLFFASRHLPQFKIAPEFYDTRTLLTLLDFSFYAFILTISWRLLFMTDNIVVGFVLGPVAVTFYSVGMNLVDQLRSSLGNISNIFAPLASQMDALNEKDSLRGLFFRGSRVSLIYALPGVCGLVVLGPTFLGIWMGNAFITQSGPILVVLALEVTCFALSYTCGQVLYGMDKHRINAWLSLTQAAVNFLLSSVLIRWWGGLGVAWGTLVPAMIVEAVILPIYTASILEISAIRYYIKSFIPPIIVAIPYTLWLIFLRSRGLVTGYLSLCFAICTGLILYSLLAWLIGLEKEDRNLARQWLSNFKVFLARTWNARSRAEDNLVETEEGIVQPFAASEKNVALPQPCLEDRINKIHVLTVAKYPVGGIRTYLKYVYGNLNPASYKFTVVATRFPETGLILKDLSHFEVELNECDETAGNWKLLRLAQDSLRRRPVDLIHSQGLTAGLVSILANWRSKRPHLITSHGMFQPHEFDGIKGMIKQRIMAIVLRHASLILCVSEDARENFFEFLPWYPKQKVRVVPNGIDVAPFAKVAEYRRRGLNQSRPADSAYTFAFFGRFMPAKGFDVLMDAVELLTCKGVTPRPFRILAVNQGDRIGRYKAEIRRRGLESYFEFPGFIQSVTEMLLTIDSVVVPSRSETGPLLPMEALAAGCPLIASDCSGLREVVRGTPTLVAKAGDPHSLAQQMTNAMADEVSLRVAFSDFAPIAQDRFDVRRCVVTMEELFSSSARSNSRHARKIPPPIPGMKEPHCGKEPWDVDL